MKQEIKEMWIKALRGGEYHQGKNTLKREDRFCCLGVLCDLYLKNSPPNPFVGWKPDISWCAGQNLGSTFKVHEEERSGKLPSSVMIWAGLSCDDPQLPLTFDGKEKPMLSFLNDNDASFEVIAGLIETHL